MEPEKIERSLLSSIKTPEHLNILRQDYRLTPQNFPYHPDEATFIWDYVIAYGQGPDSEILNSRFPDFEIEEIAKFDYVAREFRSDHVRRNVYIAIGGHESVIEKDAEGGLTSLISSLQSLQRRDESSRRVFDIATNSRFEDYRLRADGLNKTRLNWGIGPLDDFPVAFLKGHFVGLIADTKIGKSWIGLKIALQNYYEGQKVVVISPELTSDQLDWRVDTLLAQMHGYPISHHCLVNGLPGIEVNYKKYLSEVNREDLILYSNSVTDKLTPSSIASIVKSDDPDLVLIDGIYLVDDDEGSRESWVEMKNKCKSLKTLATDTETALLVINQTGRQRDANNQIETPALASAVAGGYDFNRFVDTLISVGGSSRDLDTRQIAVPLIRNGRAVTKASDISFYPDSGDIGRSIGDDPPMDISLLSI